MSLQIRKTRCCHYKNKKNKCIYYDMLESSSAVCGECYLYIGTDHLLRFGNIGYYVYEEYRKKGYAAEACRLLAKEALKEGLEKLTVLINDDNLPSRKVIQKLGALPVGRIAENDSEDARERTVKIVYELPLREDP